MAAYLGIDLREREVLDGNEYRNCKFIDCQMVYQGGDTPVIMGCGVLGTSRFVFEGAAFRTMDFLKGLHGGGFAPIVEQTLRGITGKKP